MTRNANVTNVASTSMQSNPAPSRQIGVATLFITIVLLIGVTLITLTSSRLGILELFVSSNYESRHTTFNKTESGLDALYSITRDIIDLNDDPGNTSYCTCNLTNTSDPDWSANCAALSVFNNCSEFNITPDKGWPNEFINDSSGKFQAQITFENIGCPPNELSTSCDSIKFAHYTLHSVYIDNDDSIAETLMGVAILVPSG